MKKILITDDVHPSLLAGFETAGFACTYIPKTTDAEVRQMIADYDGLIVNSKINVDREMFALAPKLRFVGRLGSGMEIVDLKAAEAFGVAVLSSPEGNRNAVGEHALGMLLSLSNNLIISDLEVKNFDWQREKNRGFELRGRTIGIVGFGHTGSSFAMKLLGLGVRILVYDKYLPDGFLDKFPFPKASKMAYPRFDTEGVESAISKKLGEEFDGLNYEFSTIEAVDLATIQREADIISFHLPLTAETKHFADATFFNGCKKSVVILNTSRGNVIKTKDLIEAMIHKKVIGAGLDVFENEKIIAAFKPQVASDKLQDAQNTEGGNLEISNFRFQAETPNLELKTLCHSEGTKLETQIISDYRQLFSLPNVIVSPHIAGWTHESKERMAMVLLHKIFKVLNKN
jgi:D-3-phosphoglycerate dehydrogenase / 2-oxoglutarate reductase